MNEHRGTPRFAHGCSRCYFLGQTIGGGRLTDLYVHEEHDATRSPTVIARYGDEASEYLSCDVLYAHPTGHAELYAAADLWRRKYQAERDND